MHDKIQTIALASVLRSRLAEIRFLDEQEREDIPETKNLCAKVPPQLADEVQEMSRFLGISKRFFIEQAVTDSLDRAAQIIWEHYEDPLFPGVVPSFVYRRMRLHNPSLPEPRDVPESEEDSTC